MKLAVFAECEKQKSIEVLLKTASFNNKLTECIYYGDYDAFIEEIPYKNCDAVIIAHNGALGMQAVRAAKILLHRVPLVWLSDDSAFVEESYIIGCAYFSAKPITQELLSAALNRCRAKGEN